MHTHAIELCLDGQTRYTISRDVKRQFSFEAASELVTPRGARMLVVYVTANDLPFAGAEIIVNRTNSTVNTENEGRATMGQLPAGAISGTVAADGYNNMPFSTTLATGTTGRVAVAMTPLFEGEMRVGPVTAPVTSPSELETI